MVIVSSRLAVLTVAISLMVAPAALANHSSKARKHHKLTSVSTSACCNALTPERVFSPPRPTRIGSSFALCPETPPGSGT